MKTITSHLIFAITIIQLAAARHTIPAKRAPTDSWKLIGTTVAKFTTDHDAVIVRGSYNNFRHVKLKVTDAPLRLVKMVITYDSGAPDNIEALYDIPQGGESPTIDLRGVGQRKITRIDFWYDPGEVAQGSANVTIFAMN